MQTKFSYRVLKWTFLVGAMASLGACVVTTGDGGDDDSSSAGDSGTTAGKASTAGTGGSTSTAGKTSTAGTGGAAVDAGAGAGGEAGAGPSYVAGLCQAELDTKLTTPSRHADTTLTDDDKNDPAFACRKCLKTSCEETWGTCYGDTPTTACGFGSTEKAPGEFECIRKCVATDMSSDDPQTVLEGCQDMCLDQCADADAGFVTDDTNALLDCGQTNCLADCFTP